MSGAHAPAPPRDAIARPRAGIPLSLYVHLPWCIAKCPYCDFNSHPVSGPMPEEAYVAALLADLEFAVRGLGRRELVSVYFGGGTPSLFTAASIGIILAAVARLLRLPATAEVTLEVNPGSYREGYFEALRAAGVNRLSIGVQSLDDVLLRAIGRVHDAAAARRTVAAARAAGFTRLNVDLMFGLPGQDAAGARADVAAALDLGPDHLSHYQLTLEPGTRFASRPPPLPAEAETERAQAACHALLAAQGFAHYEVSAFARPGAESRHNLNYWAFGDYLGIGAGAHAKLTCDGAVIRESRVRSPRAYLRAAGTEAALAERQRPDDEAVLLEFFINALRLRAGFTTALFEQRTGRPWAAVARRADAAQQRGLLTFSGDRVCATDTGWRFLDTLLVELAGDGAGN